MAKNKKRKKVKTSSKSKLSRNGYIKKYARNYPIHKCLINKEWKEAGLAAIYVARKKQNGNLLFGLYQVDIYCLGLKDTFFVEDIPEEEFNKITGGDTDYENVSIQSIPPNLAFNIIYGAIEYAEDLDFSPNKDFKVTEYILDDIETVEYIDIEFGQNGKPCYVQGKFDKTPKQIIRKLKEKVGEGNFTFVLLQEEDTDVFSEEFIKKHSKKMDTMTDEESYLYYISVMTRTVAAVECEAQPEKITTEFKEKILNEVVNNLNKETPTSPIDLSDQKEFDYYSKVVFECIDILKEELEDLKKNEEKEPKDD